MRLLSPQSTVLRTPRGQASVETAVVFGTIVVPAVFGLLMVSQVAWVWGSLAHLTRLGAKYAVTHCWQDSSGSNVVNYMRTNVPPMLDRQQVASGAVNIVVQYWTQDSANHQTVPFDCGESCTFACIPDAVTVTVSGYQLQGLPRLLGLEPITMPAFSTTLQVESAGGNPDTGQALP